MVSSCNRRTSLVPCSSPNFLRRCILLPVDGPDSLREQGIADEVLLDVSQNQGTALSFVHVVEEKKGDKENNDPDCSKPAAATEESEGEYESSSEEEF